jgi:hypothetical protein
MMIWIQGILMNVHSVSLRVKSNKEERVLTRLGSRLSEQKGTIK